MGQYSEPFNSECRAFGRLKETGHEELALPCYGYVLLDEKHERKLQDKFELEVNGNSECPGAVDMRGLYPGERSGKLPPIRCILKKLAKHEDGGPGYTLKVSQKAKDLILYKDHPYAPPQNFSLANARKIIRNTIRLQQLGIFNLDIRREQFLDMQFCDFSTSITVPHYMSNPELNPRLNAKEIALMEQETFVHAMTDIWDFEDLLQTIEEKPLQKTKLRDNLVVFPRKARYAQRFPDMAYSLRPTARREQERQRAYALVDPRRFDWKAFACEEPGTVSKRRETLKLPRKPERWYFDCTPEKAAKLNEKFGLHSELRWLASDEGLIYPSRFFHESLEAKEKEIEEREKAIRA